MGLRIGLDLDGCFYDFDRMLVQWATEVKGHVPDPTKVDRSAWSLAPQLGISEDEFDAWCDEAVDAGYLFRHGAPYPGSVEAVRGLAEDGHSIHFVTSRRFGLKSAHNTMDWLHEWDFPYDSITLSHDKTLVNVDVLVDDYERNWRECSEAGMRVFVMDRPWNQHLVGVDRVTCFNLRSKVADLKLRIVSGIAA